MSYHYLLNFRDWLFNLLIDYFVNSGWIIVIKDFNKSKKRSEKKFLGEIDCQDGIIYLDKDGGTPSVLIHELCHLALGINLFDQMAQNLPRSELGAIKIRRGFRSKKLQWEEDRTEEFEHFFYNSLTEKQVQTLRDFIDEARARYKNEG